MAQIIKHRRGSLEALSAVTSSLQKGEIVIASGSSNLSVTNGASIVFAVPENGQVQAVNRVLRGTNAPSTFSSATYNGLVDGVPYYASGSSTLYLLGSDGNEAINLVGNIQAFSTSVDSRLDVVEASLGGGGSVGARVAALEATSASLNSFTQSFSQSVATDFSASTAATAANLSSYSASAATTHNNYSSSAATSLSASAASINANIASLSTSVDSRLDAVENTNATQASTGSNIFYGDQVITGSMYITANLVVQGSSSLQNITASAVDIGTNIIELNTATPAVRFGGMSVQDSGSFAGVSGSLLWDSFNNHWLYVQPSSSGEEYNSAILIAGPKNTGAIGNEIGITAGYIPVASGENHISDSIISIVDGTIASIAGTLEVSGDISGSTIAGLGNATAFSTSVDSRLDSVETSIGGGGSLGSRVSGLEVLTGSYATTGSNTFKGEQIISSSLIVTNAIKGTGSIFLQPDAADGRQLEIYNTAATDVHIKGTTGLTFLGDDTNYVLVDNSSQVISITGVNGVFVSSSLNVTGSISSSVGISGSINGIGNVSAYSSSVDSRFSASAANVNSISASIASDLNSVSGAFATSIANLGNGFATDSELSSLSSSIAVRDAGQDTAVSTLSSSVNSRLVVVEAVSASAASALNSVSGAFATRVDGIDTTITSLSTSVDSRLDTLEGTFSTSVNSRLLTNVDAAAGAFASASAYSGSLASTINTLSTSVDSRLDSLESAVGAGSNIDGRLTSLEATSASLNATASNHEGRIDTLESFSSSFDTAFDISGANVTIAGDLIVNGTTTTVNSTTIELGDNIIALNGSGASNGGLLVKDVTNPNKVSGSLLWDSTGDFWKAGQLGSEHRILTVNDGVVSGSSQITISSTTGYSTFSSSVATSFSASNAEISSLSSSVASVTGNFSSSVATSFSASAASVTALSSSVATSFSASAAGVTALSTSVDSRLDVLEGNVGQALNTNSNVTFNSVTSSVNLGVAAGNTKRIAFRNTNGNLDLVPTASVAGDLLQWDGNDFVMSNTIDGGSF